MDAIEAILTRRSIRRYTKKSLPDSLIRKILEAGMSAPSAGNEQPWQFILIRDQGILNQIPSFHNHAEMLKQAAAGIVVCCDKQLEKHTGMGIQSCSAATQNMLLAVHAQGWGGVWLGIYPREERINGLKELLHIPDHVVPISLVSIGYPAEHKPRAERFKESRIHYDHW
jgi:nitroreductase